MTHYSAKVKLTVTRTYDVILDTLVTGVQSGPEADAAREQIRYEALGMKQADLDALDETVAQAGCYQGEETTVLDVWDVREEVPDEEDVIVSRINREDASHQGFAEWAAQDPDGAAEEALDILESPAPGDYDD